MIKRKFAQERKYITLGHLEALPIDCSGYDKLENMCDRIQKLETSVTVKRI